MSKKDTLKLLSFFLAKQKKGLPPAIFFSAVAALLEVFSLGIILPLLYFLLDTGNPGDNGFIFKFFDNVLPAGSSRDKLVYGSILVISLSFLKLIFQFVNEYFAAKFSSELSYKIREDLFKKTHLISYQNFLKQKHSDLIHLVFVGSNRISFCIWMIVQVIPEIMKLFFISSLLFMANTSMAAGASLFLIVMLFLIGGGLKSFSVKLGRLFHFQQKDLLGIFNTYLKGYKSIRVFDVIPTWNDKFAESSLAQVSTMIKQRIVNTIPKNVLESMIISGFFGLLLLFNFMNIDLKSNLHVIGFFFMAMVKMLPSFHLMNRARLEVQSQSAELTAAYDFLKLDEERDHDIHPVEEQNRGAIAFEDVTFFYDSSSEPVLDSINLEFVENGINVVVGRSGSGKSTILNLISKLLFPTTGVITLHGNDITHRLGGGYNVGVVPQEPFILNGTIRENVIFGRIGISDEMIWSSLNSAGLGSFIKSLNEQLDFKVTEDGSSLSGGQRQRLMIARALVTNPSILILDEATSALDGESEDVVLQTLVGLRDKVTMIFISHRENSVNVADRVYFLSGGNLVATGTHQYLLNNSKDYKGLFPEGIEKPKEVVNYDGQ
jgi:ABC-type bacteriocin/lantibiotic exporter with double-glycine peptidase domain